MNAIPKVKDTPNTKQDVCTIHGEFESKNYLGNVWTKCPICSKQEADRLDGIEKQKEADKEKRIIDSKFQKTGLPPRFREKSFDKFNPVNEKASHVLDFCIEFSQGFPSNAVKSGQSMLFVGKPGTGKTHLASSICLALMDGGYSVLFSSAFKIVRRIKESWRADSIERESAVIDFFSTVDFLVIDELGVQFGSDTEKLLLFEVLNGRYENRKPTLLISNLPGNGVKDYLGERVFDRLREDGGKYFVFDWNSQRGADK